MPRVARLDSEIFGRGVRAEEIFANSFAGNMPEWHLPLNGPGCSPCSRDRLIADEQADSLERNPHPPGPGCEIFEHWAGMAVREPLKQTGAAK